jgi:phage shock protein PspC (stress-responsive transcriptional regulator)
VSAGIADRIGIDVLVVRGILVVIAILGGPAVLLYALAWLVLPDTHNRIHLEDLTRGKFESPVAAIAILIALSLLPFAQGFWWFGSVYWGAPNWGDSVGRSIWTVVILAVLIWFVVWLSRRSRRGSHPTTTMPATTDDRPETIPAPPVTAPTEPLPAPAAGATADEVAAWRASQAQWKADHQAYRQQQAAEQVAAMQAASLAARTERVARALEYREERARTRSNPLYSAALIGVALIAGAVTTLVIGNGAPLPFDYLTGFAVAVGVLGLGIILNGALGRRAGGASGMAVLLAIPLLLAAVFPQSDILQYSGTTSHVYHASATQSARHYVQLTGDTTIDLSDYFATSPPPSAQNPLYNNLSIFVGSGDVTVIVPGNTFEYLHAATGSGTITGVTGFAHHGSYETNLRPSGAPLDTAPDQDLDVAVYVASGNVTFKLASTGANQ